jgi:hypothetical protein
VTCDEHAYLWIELNRRSFPLLWRLTLFRRRCLTLCRDGVRRASRIEPCVEWRGIYRTCCAGGARDEGSDQDDHKAGKGSWDGDDGADAVGCGRRPVVLRESSWRVCVTSGARGVVRRRGALGQATSGRAAWTWSGVAVRARPSAAAISV